MADSLYATSAQGAAMPGANECPGKHMPKRSSEVLEDEDCGEREPRKRRREEYGATLEATKVVFNDGSFEVGATVGKIVGRGHSYEELQMSGNARMHAGDTHNINISGPVTNLRVSYGASIESIHGRDAADQIASDLRLECKKTALEFLWMLQRLFSRVALPKQVALHVAYLEDALGNFHKVDPGLMNWERLHCEIAVSFSGQPGNLRVAQKRYRFVDDSRSGDLIDPKKPPRFTDIFQPGRHVRMNMHFESYEVPRDRCPNCRFEQVCNVGSETTCMSCRFSYHGCAEEVDMADLLARKHSGGSETMSEHAHCRFMRHDQDKPNQFRRISISIRFANELSVYRFLSRLT